VNETTRTEDRERLKTRPKPSPFIFCIFASVGFAGCAAQSPEEAPLDTTSDVQVVPADAASDAMIDDLQSEETAAVDAASDAVIEDLHSEETTAADTDTPDLAADTLVVSDATIEPAPWATGESYRVEGPRGTWTSGELVAIYDHSLWWGEADNDKTLAFFDADRFADWPDDASIQLVDESEIIARETIETAAPILRDWLTQQGFGWQRVPIDGVAYVMAASERHHLAERGYGDFATDLGRTDDSGQRWTGDGLDLQDYTSWDVPVFAPVGGVIVEVMRDAPDSPIGGDPEAIFDAPENLVGLWLGGAWHAYFLHFQDNSVPAELVVGRAVAEGEPLGRIGNSGTSIEPHLHLVLHYWDAARVRYWSLPVDYFDVQASASPHGAVAKSRAKPTGGTWISSSPF